MGLIGIAMGLAGVLYLGAQGIASVRHEADALATREYQGQQTLIAQQASDRLSSLLIAGRDALRAGADSTGELPSALQELGAKWPNTGPTAKGPTTLTPPAMARVGKRTTCACAPSASRGVA